jgi:hypothetical protein
MTRICDSSIVIKDGGARESKVDVGVSGETMDGKLIIVAPDGLEGLGLDVAGVSGFFLFLAMCGSH